MANPLISLTEGGRIFLTSVKTRIFPKKYPGNATEICQQIVKDCWNNDFFQTSTTNFPQFWTRDFGWCVSALMKLGYEKEVHRTLKYAINRFRIANKITTTITPNGKPYDFPDLASDSLPWLIHSIKVSKFPYYDYKDFINNEIIRYFEKVINSQMGIVKQEIRFSSIKDFAIRKSSCYDNCMVAMMAKDLKEMRLINPFEKYNYQIIIKEFFWNGRYFYDDLTKKEYVAGDANLFPFLLGIFDDPEMLKSSLEEIKKAGLDQPFPLKYTASRDFVKFIPQELMLKDYESNSIWTHMGPLFILLTKKVDPALAESYKLKYREMIEKHGNYLEVFDSEGSAFGTPFYCADRGMLWAANYLML